MKRPSMCCIVVLALAAPLLAGGTATFDLLSPDAGATVAGDHLVEWTIKVTVSVADNMGLALASLDLVQDAGNPAFFNIPAATSVPLGMEGFDRPAGISNPDQGGSGSAYGGSSIGMEGAKNLIQVGGAQNTFGAAAGGIGLDVDVDAGVGQGAEGQVIATGSFPMPTTPGAYTFSIQSAIANTLDTINLAPQWSPVSEAAIVMGNPSFSVTVCQPGDINGDFTLTLEQDLPLFVDLLLGESTGGEYAQCAADLNGDEHIDGKDIAPFVTAFVGE